MAEPLKIGALYKSLKTQFDASQKIYQLVVDLADIESNLDSDLSKQKFERLLRLLVDVADRLSENVDEMNKLVEQSLQPAR